MPITIIKIVYRCCFHAIKYAIHNHNGKIITHNPIIKPNHDNSPPAKIRKPYIIEELPKK